MRSFEKYDVEAGTANGNPTGYTFKPRIRPDEVRAQFFDPLCSPAAGRGRLSIQPHDDAPYCVYQQFVDGSETQAGYRESQARIVVALE